jgi:hypothetical protein
MPGLLEPKVTIWETAVKGRKKCIKINSSTEENVKIWSPGTLNLKALSPSYSNQLPRSLYDCHHQILPRLALIFKVIRRPGHDSWSFQFLPGSQAGVGGAKALGLG